MGVPLTKAPNIWTTVKLIVGVFLYHSAFGGSGRGEGGRGREFRHRNNNRIIVSFFRHRPGGEGRAELRHRNNNFVQNLFCFKLDAMSVPEALATTIRILLMFSIVLAQSRG